MEDNRIVRGEDDVLNELDEYAIEEAVSLVEEHGGEVIALTMGPEDAEEAVTRALQMGADRGVVITDDSLEASDAAATAQVLAAAIRTLSQDGPVDLVLTGMASLDGMTSLLAPGLAAVLDWPLLDLASAVEVQVSEGVPVVTVRRSADGWEDELRAAAPVVVSVTDQINEPRYPSFKDLRAARSKPLDVLELAEVGLDSKLMELAAEGALSASRVLSTEQVERLPGVIVTDSGDGGVRLAEYLERSGVVSVGGSK